MKQGMPIDEFVAEIHRLDQSKQDFVATTDRLQLHQAQEARLGYELSGQAEDEQVLFMNPVKETAHEQIGARLGIPRSYYTRCDREAPDLLLDNVNYWFRQKNDRRLIRILDGKVRAFLSDRYARIDHVDVLRAIEQPLVHLQGECGARVESCQVTDAKMYVKIVVPGIEEAVDVGDVVQAGFVISNSEIGAGAFTVQQMVYRLVCKNGMVRGQSLRKTHLGGRISDDGDASIWSDDTRRSEDNTTLLAARDVVRAATDMTRFQAVVARMREVGHMPDATNSISTVERLGKTYGLSDVEQGLVLNCFVANAPRDGLGLYGLLNAVTEASQSIEDYERATDLEELGGNLLDLTSEQWSALRA